MTAELLIMNGNAIAMATDSAVTVGDIKTFNGANKLFMLSNDPPMGIMIFGNSDFDNFPIETLIKEFKKESDFAELKNIKNIQKEFVRFLSKVTPPTDFKNLIDDNLEYYKEFLEENFESLTPEEFDNFINSYVPNDNLNFVSELDEFDNYDWDLDDVIPDFVLPEDKQDIYFILKMMFFDNFIHETGVVIAGFNSEEMFPSYMSFNLIANNNGVIENNILGCKFNYPECIILPFAQTDVINAFMTGIDLEMKKLIEDLFEGVFDDYLETLENYFSNDKHFSKSALDEINKKFEIFKSFKYDMMDWFRDEIQRYQNEFSQPIFYSVEALPNEELVDMCEELINITSLKRKVSSNLQSVGGEIDVALISKGDGFVWKKRKDVIDTNLNLHFINENLQ